MERERGVYKIKAGRIVYCKLLPCKNEFSGSKGFRGFYENGSFVVKKKYEKKKENVEVSATEGIDVSIVGSSASGSKKFEKKNKNYKVKANEVKDRANAIFSLKRSKQCMAFVTISFPAHMSDDSIFKCYNKFMTRVRKVMSLKYYLWVTERQKNGTLHFHIIINQYVNVRVINAYMAMSIENELKKNRQDGVNFDKSKYNGVDLKRCDNNIKKLSSYLTKYVSKSKDTFSHLAWHCSRAVSNLMTAYDTPYYDEIFSVFGSRFEVRKYWHCDHADIMYISRNDTLKLIRLLGCVNNLIDNYKEPVCLPFVESEEAIIELKQFLLFEE